MLKSALIVMSVVCVAPAGLHASIVEEVLRPKSGGGFDGTFEITPCDIVWAFGVANEAINDTSISGISLIDGVRAKDHWVSALISRDDWDMGFDFDSIRPIGATSPSSFSIDTTLVAWQWGSEEYVAFYWLSEDGDEPGNPLAVLQPDTEYDAFKFFTSGPGSPFATFNARDGGDIFIGETISTVIPEPSSIVILGLGTGLVLLGSTRHRVQTRTS